MLACLMPWSLLHALCYNTHTSTCASRHISLHLTSTLCSKCSPKRVLPTGHLVTLNFTLGHCQKCHTSHHSVPHSKSLKGVISCNPSLYGIRDAIKKMPASNHYHASWSVYCTHRYAKLPSCTLGNATEQAPKPSTCRARPHTFGAPTVVPTHGVPTHGMCAPEQVSQDTHTATHSTWQQPAPILQAALGTGRMRQI